MDRTIGTCSRAASGILSFKYASTRNLFAIMRTGMIATSMYASLAVAGTDDTRVDLELTSSDEPTYAANGGKPLSLTAKKLSPIRAIGGANAEFWVNDYNPLLFTYSSSSKETQTDEAKAIQQFADAVAKFT